MLSMLRLVAAAVLLACAALPYPARAETYQTCAGFIDTLPATITTQGVWCLRHDLSTAITSGNAITISTNNVTIDCNDFKLGGLSAGAGTSTRGIYANNRFNATVRHCNVRGFYYGVYFIGSGGGHVVEDNRIDGNTYTGLHVEGDGSVVRRNQITDTGGSSVATGEAIGIHTVNAVDVLDNTVSGVLPTEDLDGNAGAIGIVTAFNPNGSISGNRVRGVVWLGTGLAYGILNGNSGRISVRSNDLSGNGGTGVSCSPSGSARDNTISGFASAMGGCTDSGGNAVIP